MDIVLDRRKVLGAVAAHVHTRRSSSLALCMVVVPLCGLTCQDLTPIGAPLTPSLRWLTHYDGALCDMAVRHALTSTLVMASTL